MDGKIYKTNYCKVINHTKSSRIIKMQKEIINSNKKRNKFEKNITFKLIITRFPCIRVSNNIKDFK